MTQEQDLYNRDEQDKWTREVEENFRKRVILLSKCKNDRKAQSSMMELCKRDSLFFFEWFAFTDKNSKFLPDFKGDAVPFILFDFQKEFVIDTWDAICQWQRRFDQRTRPCPIFVEKSRQMGLSWLIIGIFVYGYIFHNHKYLCVSQSEDDVDKSGDMQSLFEKIRFMIANIPKWMLPKGLERMKGTEHNKHMAITRADGSGSISGKSASPRAWRGGTYAAVLMDECAHIMNATKIDGAISAACDVRIYNSTPDGKHNMYYKKRQIALDGHIRYHRLHWTRHPFYTQAWYDNERLMRDKLEISRELDISYDESMEGRVYPDLKEEYADIEYDKTLPLYTFIDNSHGGSDPHAIVSMQPDGDNWNIIDYLEINCSVTEMAHILAKRPRESLSYDEADWFARYCGYKKSIFISDPYDTNGTLNESTIYEEYRKVDIHLNIPWNRKKESQIAVTRGNMHRLRFHKRTEILLWSLMNARYPNRSEDSQSTSAVSKPIHDQTSHGRSAMEYGITWISEQDGYNQKPRELYEEIGDPLTGEVEKRRVIFN